MCQNIDQLNHCVVDKTRELGFEIQSCCVVQSRVGLPTWSRLPSHSEAPVLAPRLLAFAGIQYRTHIIPTSSMF